MFSKQKNLPALNILLHFSSNLLCAHFTLCTPMSSGGGGDLSCCCHFWSGRRLSDDESHPLETPITDDWCHRSTEISRKINCTHFSILSLGLAGDGFFSPINSRNFSRYLFILNKEKLIDLLEAELALAEIVIVESSVSGAFLCLEIENGSDRRE